MSRQGGDSISGGSAAHLDDILQTADYLVLRGFGTVGNQIARERFIIDVVEDVTFVGFPDINQLDRTCANIDTEGPFFTGKESCQINQRPPQNQRFSVLFNVGIKIGTAEFSNKTPILFSVLDHQICRQCLLS